jgi:hypothetical protein
VATLQVETNLPELTQTHSLEGWRREFCIELLGEGVARIFVRTVETGSLRANEQQRAILFHRLDPRFTDMAGCIESMRHDLNVLADSARRTTPNKENLFAAVSYDRAAWSRVQHGIDRWIRR